MWSLLLLFFLFSTVLGRGADWPYYQHDPQRTGRSSATVDPNKLQLAWSAPPGYSTPLVVGDTIYATHNQQGVSGGDNATLISAFDLVTGRIKWTFSDGRFAFPSQAAVGGGLVVFHTGILFSEAGQLPLIGTLWI